LFRELVAPAAPFGNSEAEGIDHPTQPAHADDDGEHPQLQALESVRAGLAGIITMPEEADIGTGQAARGDHPDDAGVRSKGRAAAQRSGSRPSAWSAYTVGNIRKKAFPSSAMKTARLMSRQRSK